MDAHALFRRGLDGRCDGEGAEMIVDARCVAVAGMEIVQNGAQHQPHIVHEWLLHRQRHVLHRFRALMDDMQAVEESGLHERTRACSPSAR